MAPELERKTVLIVDHHPIMRRGIARLLEGPGDLAVCGEAASVEEALQAVEKNAPDGAIVDVGLSDRSGIDLIREMHVRRPDLAILAYCEQDESLLAERVLRAGARGFVNKRQTGQTLLKALRRVLAGEVYLDRRLASEMLRTIMTGQGPSDAPQVEGLSDRQLQVFEMIGRGLTTQQIADRLDLKATTVETYRERIKKRLGLDTMMDLLKYAVEWVRFEQEV